MIVDFICGLIKIFFGTTVYFKEDFSAQNTQRIYYANHSSNLDFLIIWASLPRMLREKTRPVAALDYWGQGGIRQLLANKVFNAILIDRRQSNVRENPLHPVYQALTEGSSIIIFPEGTRSLDGTLQEFKSGIFHLYRQHPEAQVVPVYLHNLNRILPKGEFLMVPLLSRIIFGKPVRFESELDKKSFLALTKGALQELMN